MKINEATLLVTERQKIECLSSASKRIFNVGFGRMDWSRAETQLRGKSLGEAARIEPIYNLLIFRDKYLANNFWIVFARESIRSGNRVSACC